MQLSDDIVFVIFTKLPKTRVVYIPLNDGEQNMTCFWDTLDLVKCSRQWNKIACTLQKQPS